MKKINMNQIIKQAILDFPVFASYDPILHNTIKSMIWCVKLELDLFLEDADEYHTKKDIYETKKEVKKYIEKYSQYI